MVEATWLAEVAYRRLRLMDHRSLLAWVPTLLRGCPMPVLEAIAAPAAPSLPGVTRWQRHAATAGDGSHGRWLRLCFAYLSVADLMLAECVCADWCIASLDGAGWHEALAAGPAALPGCKHDNRQWRWLHEAKRHGLRPRSWHAVRALEFATTPSLELLVWLGQLPALTSLAMPPVSPLADAAMSGWRPGCLPQLRRLDVMRRSEQTTDKVTLAWANGLTAESLSALSAAAPALEELRGCAVNSDARVPPDAFAQLHTLGISSYVSPLLRDLVGMPRLRTLTVLPRWFLGDLVETVGACGSHLTALELGLRRPSEWQWRSKPTEAKAQADDDDDDCGIGEDDLGNGGTHGFWMLARGTESAFLRPLAALSHLERLGCFLNNATRPFVVDWSFVSSLTRLRRLRIASRGEPSYDGPQLLRLAQVAPPALETLHLETLPLSAEHSRSSPHTPRLRESDYEPLIERFRGGGGELLIRDHGYRYSSSSLSRGTEESQQEPVS